jgi:hypothetical protein
MGEKRDIPQSEIRIKDHPRVESLSSHPGYSRVDPTQLHICLKENTKLKIHQMFFLKFSNKYRLCKAQKNVPENKSVSFSVSILEINVRNSLIWQTGNGSTQLVQDDHLRHSYPGQSLISRERICSIFQH